MKSKINPKVRQFMDQELIAFLNDLVQKVGQKRVPITEEHFKETSIHEAYLKFVKKLKGTSQDEMFQAMIELVLEKSKGFAESELELAEGIHMCPGKLAAITKQTYELMDTSLAHVVMAHYGTDDLSVATAYEIDTVVKGNQFTQHLAARLLEGWQKARLAAIRKPGKKKKKPNSGLSFGA